MQDLKRAKSLFVFFLLIMFLSSVSANALTIKMAFMSTNAIPFKWKTENNEYTGPIIDIMQELGRRMGIEIASNGFPPKRVLAHLKNGKVHGAFGLSRTADREKWGDYLNTPIGWFGTSLFMARGEEFSFNKIEDLYGRTVYVVRGVSLGKAYHKAVKEGKIKENPVSDYQALVKITSLRPIIAASPTAPFLQNAEKMGLSKKIDKLPNPLRPVVSLHIVFSKKTVFPGKLELVQKMNEVLNKMEKDGTIEKIYRKYGYVFDIRK